MNLAGISLRRPVTILMVCLAIVAAGLAAARLLPIALWPETDWPVLFVQVEAPGSSPEELEEEVIRPLEDSISMVAGINQLRSNVSPDSAELQVEFHWGEEMAPRNMEVEERIDTVRGELPDSVENIQVLTGDTDDIPVVQFEVSADKDLTGEYRLLERQLLQPLERLEGVSRIELWGVQPSEYEVRLNPDRLAATDLDADEVVQLLQANHQTLALGTLHHPPQRQRLRSNSQLADADAIRDQPLGNGLRVGDVAEVVESSDPVSTVRTLDGQRSIGLNVFREPNENIVDLSERVHAEVEALAQDPELEEVSIRPVNDQADAVTDSLQQLLRAGMLGGLLALMVLWGFLRSLRTTLVVVGSIPIALSASLAVLYLAGLSLNVLSMMGLMLAIGMLVDNAVVVSENIFRHRQQGHGPLRASLVGTREVAMAVTAGTLTTILVFLPILVAPQSMLTVQLEHVAVAIVITLVASLLIALSFIPLVISRMRGAQVINDREDPVRRLARRYGGALHWCLQRPRRIGLLALLVLVSVLIPAQQVGTDLAGSEEAPTLVLDHHIEGHHPRDDVGAAVEQTESVLFEHREALGIERVFSFYGTGSATTFVHMEDDAPHPAGEVRERLSDQLPETAISEARFRGERGGGADALSVRVEGERSEELPAMARELAERLNTIEGVAFAQPDLEDAPESLRIHPDPVVGENLGLHPAELARQVSQALSGQRLESLRGHNGEMDLNVIYRMDERRDASSLATMPLNLPEGQALRLDAAAHLQRDQEADQIQRVDRRAAAYINLELEDDATSMEVRNRIEQSLEDLHLPPGFRWGFGSAFQQEMDDLNMLMLTYLLAVLLIFLVMASLFEALLKPLAILSSILFSIVGVYWFFLMTGTPFTFMAMIGVLVLMGVVVNNGIVLVDQVNRLRWQGMDRIGALCQGSMDRFRPILMTVATTILGLLPLAISDARFAGDGPSYQPMAQAIIGGLGFSTLVSLFFLPVLYLGLDEAGIRARRAWRRAGEALPGTGKHAGHQNHMRSNS